MFCKKCGKELGENQVFCPDCGWKINSEAYEAASNIEIKNAIKDNFKQQEPSKKKVAKKIVLIALLSIITFFLMISVSMRAALSNKSISDISNAIESNIEFEDLKKIANTFDKDNVISDKLFVQQLNDEDIQKFLTKSKADKIISKFLEDTRDYVFADKKFSTFDGKDIVEFLQSNENYQKEYFNDKIDENFYEIIENVASNIIQDMRLELASYMGENAFAFTLVYIMTFNIYFYLIFAIWIFLLLFICLDSMKQRMGVTKGITEIAIVIIVLSIIQAVSILIGMNVTIKMIKINFIISALNKVKNLVLIYNLVYVIIAVVILIVTFIISKVLQRKNKENSI